MKFTSLLPAPLLLLCLLPPSLRANTVLNFAATTSTISIGVIPDIGTFTLGQSFTTTSDTILTNFEFYGYQSGTQNSFQIASWNGSSPGPVLFSTPIPASPTLAPLVIDPHSLVLGAHSQYVAYVSSISSRTSLNLSLPVYPGGSIVSSNRPEQWGSLPGTPVAFLAIFQPAPTVVPLPSAARSALPIFALLAGAKALTRKRPRSNF